jgi:glycosyltransferase involved in cell wall biosynthesis
LILEQKPGVIFDCPAMKGEPEAEHWVQPLNIEAHVRLLPKLGATELAEVYRRSQVMVSPSVHDGTPNSLLEAMACGVFPVCGNLESIREWITDGENGLLVDPASPRALADATLRALDDAQLRAAAAKVNARLVTERADYSQNMQRIETFYQAL